MPIYEYQCQKCGTFEITQGIPEKPLNNVQTARGRATLKAKMARNPLQNLRPLRNPKRLRSPRKIPKARALRGAVKSLPLHQVPPPLSWFHVQTATAAYFS